MSMTLREQTNGVSGTDDALVTEGVVQTPARRNARKTSARHGPQAKKSPKPKHWDPNKIYPELGRLPFVKYLDRPAGETQCDWWHIASSGRKGCFADLFLGARYAQMTVDFMAVHPDRLVLARIFEAMASKRSFELGDDRRDSIVASGFISEVKRMLWGTRLRAHIPMISHPNCAPMGLGPRSFIIHMHDGSSLVCDPDVPIEHGASVAIVVDGQFLARGTVETKHPAKAKTLTLRVDNRQWSVPDYCAREDIAPIVSLKDSVR